MLAISLWQPWASLLAHGAKRVETRSWPIRHRGPILVHAAKRWDAGLAALCEEEPFFSALAANVATSDSWRAADLPRGAIVGRVELVDCYPTEAVRFKDLDSVLYDILYRIPPRARPAVIELSELERPFGDYSPGRFAWLCTNPVAFPDPVPFRGGRGLFEVPDNLLAPAGV